MIIEPSDDELKMILDIAIGLAPNYAMRKLVLAGQSIDRNAAASVITDRVMKALGRYKITRDALPHEEALGTLPLFPEDRFHQNLK